MKINKQLLENKILTEAPEDDAKVEPIDITDTKDEVANDLVQDIAVASDGDIQISDKQADTVAAEVINIGKELDTTNIAIAADDAPLGIQNDLTKKLDKALAVAKKQQGDMANGRAPRKGNSNVMVIGLPGSGKTATIYDWAMSNGLNILYVNAKDPDLETTINGVNLRDMETSGNRMTKAYSNLLDPLDRKNSVLFLDEFNRAKTQLRASLLTMIEEKAIAGNDKNGRRVFKNLLFTIAAINPPLPTDPGAQALSSAERSRFAYTAKFDSNTSALIAYLNTYYLKKLIPKLDVTSANYQEDLEEFLRIADLGLFIAQHPDFKFDTIDDEEDLYDQQRTQLNQRALTNGLANTAGSKAAFVEWLNDDADFLDRDRDMLLNIVNEYTELPLDALIKKYQINASIAATAASKEETTVSPADTAETNSNTSTGDSELDSLLNSLDDSEEDDASFFAQNPDDLAPLTPAQANDRIKAAIALF